MKMIDYIKSAFKDILDIEKKLNVLENEMTTNYDEEILNKYNELLSRYEYMGGYKYKKEGNKPIGLLPFRDVNNEFSLEKIFSSKFIFSLFVRYGVAM